MWTPAVGCGTTESMSTLPASTQVLDELRVRRLAVVDEHGVECVVAETRGGAAELRLELPDQAVVTLVAASDPQLGSLVGLHISADGDSVAELLAYREADHWQVTASGLP